MNVYAPWCHKFNQFQSWSFIQLAIFFSSQLFCERGGFSLTLECFWWFLFLTQYVLYKYLVFSSCFPCRWVVNPRFLLHRYPISQIAKDYRNNLYLKRFVDCFLKEKYALSFCCCWEHVFCYEIQVLELLEVIQFRSPDTTMKLSQIVSNMKYDLMVRLHFLLVLALFLLC